MKVNEEKIIEVAHRLFKQYGVRETNLQQVAQLSCLNLRDIKIILKSKKDLMFAVIKQTLNREIIYLLINSSLSSSAVTELDNFFRFTEDTITDFGPEILTELRRFHPLALNQIREIIDNKLIPYLQRIIVRGLSEGFYRDDFDQDLYIPSYIYVLFSVLENKSYDWAQTKRMINHINDIFLHGVLNAKGMRIYVQGKI